MRRARTSPPRLPARDPALAARVRIERDRRDDERPTVRSLALPPIETDPFGSYVEFVELILEDERLRSVAEQSQEHDATEWAEALRATEVMTLAGLAEISLLAGVPEHIMIQIAFGESTGRRNARRIARLLALARQRGMSADEYILDAAAQGELDQTLTRLFHGDTKRRPDDDRVQRGIASALRAAAHVDAEDRPGLLCMIAWLHWASGRRAVALSYAHEAQRIEPRHLLAYGVAWLIATKTPRWL